MINKGIERLHEKKIMNNGKLAEIIAYRSANDIDVKFENGVKSVFGFEEYIEQGGKKDA